MKKTIIILLIIALLAIGAYLLEKNKGRVNLGGGGTLRLITLVGSSSDANKIPAIYVKANATNTDPTFDGGTVTQNVLTSGVNTVRLNFMAKGSISTSTVDVRLMGSFDGVNYYNLMYSTSTPNLSGNGTTTSSLAPYVTTFVPGTATTSWSYDYNVTGTNFVRFLLKSDNAGHLNLGSQAYIQAIAVDEF